MRGFTLIELLITMAVVGILAALAQSAYVAQARRGNRAAAEAFLMDVATRQQQFFLDGRTYATLTTLGMNAPTQVSNHYNVVATPVAGPPPSFTVTATPTGPQVNDSCGTLSITSAGVKSPANCW